MAHQDGQIKAHRGSLALGSANGDTIPIRWTLSWIVHMRSTRARMPISRSRTSRTCPSI